MSAHDHDFPETTKTQFILATLGALFAPLLVLFLVARLLLSIDASHIDDPVEVQTPAIESAAPAASAGADSDAQDNNAAADESAAPAAESEAEDKSE